MQTPKEFNPACPLPISDYPTVQLAHGGGGTLMHQLIEKMFLSAFGKPPDGAVHDSAVVQVKGARFAFTTDSYVVRPLFFPGGDIGSLAVYGTVNDLAMSGARALYMSAGFILEEGFAMEALWRVVQSMRNAAGTAGVRLVTGDTKVVDKGKGDGVYINTAGIGVVEHGLEISPLSVRRGDAVILSGDIGRHGIAVMAVREGLEFQTAVQSDLAPLWGPVSALLQEGLEVHCLRDLTRGGLSSAVVEIAEAAGVHIVLDERSIPVREEVHAACEILGFDPLYVANEGRFVAFVPEAQAERALAALRSIPPSRDACLIGRVEAEPKGMVTLRSRIGATRIVDMLSGEQLPRIC